MRNPQLQSIQTAFLVFCGAVLLSSLSPGARADLSPHAQADTFAAETAALLPAASPPMAAAAVAPTDRSTLGDWSAVIAWTPHIPVSAAALPDGRVFTDAFNQRTTF